MKTRLQSVFILLYIISDVSVFILFVAMVIACVLASLLVGCGAK